MKNSKLIKLMKTLTSAEMKELENFLLSPYFSRGRDLSTFFRHLKRFHPLFESKQLSSENVYSELNPGKPFDKSASNIIYTMSSDLFKICKDYLSYSGFNDDNSRRQYYLLNKLREKKQYDEFEKEYRNFENEKGDLFKGNALDFLNKYYQTESYLEYCVESGKPDEAFQSIFELGNFAAIVSLVYGYRNPDIAASARFYKIDAGYNLIDNLIEHLDSEGLLAKMKENNDKLYPYACVNFASYNMVKFPNEDKYYFEFKNLTERYISFFGHVEKYLLYSIMGSYCARRLQADSSDRFNREEFEVHKRSMELGIYRYSSTDRINVSRFRNIVGSAFDVNEIDWLGNFVENHITELEEQYIENMRNYSYEYIYLGRKEFGKALESLIKVKYDFFLFKVDVKHLMIILYFELGLVEQAYYMIDTMKHYL